MSTDLEKEIQEIQLDDMEVEKKEENQINLKIAKPKRNPFEKIIDDSIIICDEIIEKDQSESNVDRLLKTMEKEIMKKEEFYNLVKLYEQTKKLKEDQTNFEDTKVKGEFNEIKNNLQNIKNLYENKKKILNKNKAEEKEKEEKIEQPSKKKTSNKKSSEIIDVSNIVGKISTIVEEKIEEKEIMEECKTPVIDLEFKESIEMAEPEGILASPAQNKNLDSKESLILSVESVLIKNSIAKENSSKKTKSENNNKSITNFFKPKIAPLISNSLPISLARVKSYNEDDFKSQADNENNLMNLDLQAENEILNNLEPLKSKERKHSNQAMFIINSQNRHLSTLDYRIENLQSNSSLNKTSYYTIKGNNISDKTAYHQSFKNYFEEISQLKKTSYKTKINKRKIIYIHDSFLTHRKILNKFSNVIKGRNPFKKDEYLIDYDKDSEEEFLEENAEDIKSNDNSADEEEIPEDEEEDAIKWIVPDGHLSEDEVSQTDELDNPGVNAKKKKTVMEIMEIRKNFPKPVVVSFSQSVTSMDHKVKFLYNLCKAKIFHLNPANNDNTALVKYEENILELDDNLNTTANSKQFPIKLTSNKSEETGRKTGMNNNIKDKLEDLVREIHLSYMTKEYLIKVITEKFNDISKKSLCNFFKDSVLKVKCKNTLRKQWLVKKEILENANFLMSEYNTLLEKQNALYEEKDKEKKKEIEENQMNNQNIRNERREVNFPNFDIFPTDIFDLNNLPLVRLRKDQISNSGEINPSPLNNPLNIPNPHINNNDLLYKILNPTVISKKKRIKKEKSSPKNQKTKSKVKLNNNSAKKEAENRIVNNDQQFDLRTFNFQPVMQELNKKERFDLNKL